jgi:hypothetical protein
MIPCCAGGNQSQICHFPKNIDYVIRGKAGLRHLDFHCRSLIPQQMRSCNAIQIYEFGNQILKCELEDMFISLSLTRSVHLNTELHLKPILPSIKQICLPPAIVMRIK